jgi:hypothetical protein
LGEAAGLQAGDPPVRLSQAIDWSLDVRLAAKVPEEKSPFSDDSIVATNAPREGQAAGISIFRSR